MRRSVSVLSALALAASGLAATAASAAPPSNPGTDRASEVAAYWTADRMAAAQPRDLVLDDRGLAYLRGGDGSLQPYGHGSRAQADKPVEQGKPSGGGGGGGKPGGGTADSLPPAVTDRSPADGAATGSTVPFSATVTDASGVRSVSVVVTYPNSTRTSSFAASRSGETWGVTVSGFSAGTWTWHLVAKDASKAGNTTTTTTFSFVVGTPPTADGVVTNSRWTADSPVKRAAGRIYFEMPGKTPGSWSGYVCSGTAVTDDTANTMSTILTAAHCVYDDVNKVFARNVLFIPSQDDGGPDGTDLVCTNDPMGCWTPSYGVVDDGWASRTFPDNVAWDYAYYVVGTSGAHAGTGTESALEKAAGTLAQQFTGPSTGAGSATTALGYSYSDDPNFMYCAEDMTNMDAANWWLPSCGLSGGASGGPWVQPMQDGTGPVISVNSWGYTNQPGMAGPKLSGTSASKLFSVAQDSAATPTGGGVIVPAEAAG